MRIVGREVSTNIDSETNNKIKAHQMHSLLGNPGEAYTRVTSARLGMTLQGPFSPCHNCAVSNITQANTQKSSAAKATERGQRLCMDISSVKESSSGGARFWLLMVDKATCFQWSYFLTAKKQVKDRVLELIKHLKNENVSIQQIRCDDAGENKSTQKLLEQEGYAVNFEFTSKSTPQYNGIVERRFATLYARAQIQVVGRVSIDSRAAL